MQRILLALALCLAFPPAFAAFSFSEEEKQQKESDDASRKKVSQQLATPCKDALKDRKIMVVIGERSSKGISAQQSSYSAHFNSINQRLRNLGLKTYTQQEITAQIAQAEIDAYFRNDPDAALNASKKMGADFILRGTISSRTAMNPVLRIPEVYIYMGFTLSAADGRTISDVSASAESYSGTDTLGMALTLVNEQASGVVARLYNDYCRNAGISGAAKKKQTN
jgi:hypothetical protein